VRRRRVLGGAHLESATLTRYVGLAAGTAARVSAGGPDASSDRAFTIDDLIASGRRGDEQAMAALQATARYLGIGLGAIVNILNPDRCSSAARSPRRGTSSKPPCARGSQSAHLTPAAALADIVVVGGDEHPRLRGAAMLVSAPAFAAPVVA